MIKKIYLSTQTSQHSSFPRKRESSVLIELDSRFRGNDKILIRFDLN
jgi:hypothetical protein